MYTPQILTRIDVIEDEEDSNYFRVVGSITAAGDYYDKVIVVSNDNIGGELKVAMSSVLPSDIEVAKRMAELYVNTINQAIVEKMKRAKV